MRPFLVTATCVATVFMAIVVASMTLTGDKLQPVHPKLSILAN